MSLKQNTILDRSGPRIKTAALLPVTRRGSSDKWATSEYPVQHPPAKSDICIGTWNVRSLKEKGKLEILVNEISTITWNILGIAEMRWKGIGEETTEDGHKVWYSGEENKHIYGVGFLVERNTAKSVIECTPVSSRLISIRLACKPLNLTIIQVYAPTRDCNDEEIEKFYDDLNNLIKKIPKKDLMIIQGDWNAKIGFNDTQDWKGTTGPYGVGKTNERGLRMLEFAKQNHLVVANTLHNHKLSRKTTWHSPDGKTHNQIDYILVDRKIQSGINRTRTRVFNKPDIGSDHDPVVMTIKMKLSTNRTKPNQRTMFNLDKLLDTEIAAKYQSELSNRFAPLLLLDNEITQHLCDEFTNIITETANTIIGKSRPTKKPWITTEILSACDERRGLKKERFNGTQQLEDYRKSNKKVRKAINTAKNDWIEKQAAEIEEGLNNNTRKAYKIVKNLTQEKGKTVNIIENKNGELLTNKNDVASRWKEYCTELYQHNADTDRTILTENVIDDLEDPEILRSEVTNAIKQLKAKKSPGMDNIPAELIKNGGEATVDVLHSLCNGILKTGKWPTQWTESILIPIPKKKISKKCTEHRTISLISHPSKVLLTIILNRIKPKTEAILSESQAGFRKDRSTVEQVLNLRLICEKHRNHQSKVYHNFIDFKKAFDRIWHQGLWHTMKKYKIGKGMINLVQQLYEHAKTTVMIGDTYSDWFISTVGVRQGCILSPTLFNLFLERILNDALENFEGGIKCGGLTINNLRFADDIDLIGSNNEELEDLTARLDTTSSRYGMEISDEKSKVMITGKNISEKIDIKVNNKSLEQVKDFKYLGVTMTENMTSETEVKRRIGASTSALVKLEKIWKARNLQAKSKLRLMNAMVTSILLYGCESWTVTEKIWKRIDAFEMKCYRRLLGVSWKEHKTNDYIWERIDNIFNGKRPERLMQIVQRRKLVFFGHQVRRDAWTKALMQGNCEGSRNQGRPMRIWQDDIKDWSNLKGLESYHLALDRDKWRASVKTWVHQWPNRLRS